MIEFQLSNSSKNDIEDIWVWTLENFSENQANFYVRSLLKKIEELCIDLDKEIVLELFFFKYNYIRFQSHYIFYVKNSKSNITIIRILHQNRDLKKILKS